MGLEQEWNATGIRGPVIRELRALAERHGIQRVILFGSRARGDYRRDSDIDLAVLGGNVSLFRLAAEEETSTLLRYDVVDLGQEIQAELRDAINKEGKLVYEKI